MLVRCSELTFRRATHQSHGCNLSPALENLLVLLVDTYRRLYTDNGSQGLTSNPVISDLNQFSLMNCSMIFSQY